MTRSQARPTGEEFLVAVNAVDDVALIVRAHLTLEGSITHLIYQVASPELKELAWLNLPEKVDVAIALGILTLDVRPAFKRLHAIRNKFAHNFGTALSTRDAHELRSALSPAMKRTYDGMTADFPERHATPRGRVAACIVALHVELEVEHRVREMTKENPEA